jgi:hypothetical protein
MPLVVALALVACGGTEPAGDEPGATVGEPEAPDTTSRSVERITTDDTMPVPADFPAPFMGGGALLFESSDEIRVGYPGALYDQVIEFYQQWSLGQSHRLIDRAPAYEWDFPDFTIVLEPLADSGGDYVVTIKRDG